MAVLMEAKMKVLPRKRRELLRTLAAIREKINCRETGCLGFHFCQNGQDKNLIILSMEWKTREKLDLYLKSNLHRVLMGAIEVLCEAPMILTTSRNLK